MQVSTSCFFDAMSIKLPSLRIFLNPEKYSLQTFSVVQKNIEELVRDHSVTLEEYKLLQKAIQGKDKDPSHG